MARRGKYTHQQATLLAEARGFTPTEEYPGRVSIPWGMRCLKKDCLATHRFALSELLSGRRFCRHVRAAYAPKNTFDTITPDLVKAYEGGASIRDLVKEFGLGYGTVQRRLRLSGVTLRARGGGLRAKNRSRRDE